jgi:uncharacterized protein (TIGR02147 family)
MQNHWIFNIQDSLEVLEHQLSLYGSVRGYRKQMAVAAGCQAAQMSQILGGQILLSLEQASGLSDFWQLSETEADYFMTLTQRDRAGTESLRAKLDIRLKALKSQQKKKSKTEILLDKKKAEREQTLQYYLDWIPSAVHLLWQVEGYTNNTKAVADRLNLSENELFKALELLVSMKIMSKSSGEYQIKIKHLHIGSDNFFSTLHHKNWRAKAMSRQSLLSTNNLNFTSLYSLDKKSYEQIKKKIRKLLQDVRETIDPAPEETLACLNIDFLEL